MSRIRVVLALLLALGLSIGLAATPAEAAGRKWPKGRITYVDQTRDPEAVKQAIKAWNRSGLNIRFVKVSSAKRARLLIRNSKNVPGGCGTGLATLGYPGPGRKGFVNILHGSDAEGQRCAVPGRWYCRLMSKVDLKRAKRMYGGQPQVRQPEFCDAIDRIPATGAVTPTQITGSFFEATVTRAAEPAVPAWLGTWGYGEPGFEVHATPNACTAVPGDDATIVGVGLWGATPVGGTMVENLQPLPAGLNCLSVWQFDQGYNFATLASTVMVTSTGSRASYRSVDLPTRTPVSVTAFD